MPKAARPCRHPIAVHRDGFSPKSPYLLALIFAAAPAFAQSPAAAPAAAMKAYTETIPGTTVTFDLVPIPGGKFTLGSPAGEAGRGEDEGPPVEVTLRPFWMGRCEVTWDEYEQWMFSLEKQRRQGTPTEADLKADAVTRPTRPYTDMTFGMGHDGYPAICMTQLAAQTYCQWLSAKTGRTYRLPTEAEWEYACRAGTTTAYSFGDDPALLGEHAWFGPNADGKYHKVGTKKPNPWGLHDLHGNVMEWTQDQYVEDACAKLAGRPQPVVCPGFDVTTEYPIAVRGGSWKSKAPACRSAARTPSTDEWKMQDPQLPQSRWYFTDALFVGFRVARSAEDPVPEK